MSFVRKFKSGDTVFHRPTGETWSLINDEQDGWVTPGGWPASQGRAEDCKLVESAEARAAAPTWESHGCSTPGCGYPDGKPCIRCGLVIQPSKP